MHILQELHLKQWGRLIFVKQFDEQKDHVAVEQILRVVFLDPERPSPVSHSWSLHFIEKTACLLLKDSLWNTLHYLFKQLEKLKRQLAEADAALEARKKPPEDTGPRIVGEGLVIDEWV